jgi:hypothetical protein
MGRWFWQKQEATVLHGLVMRGGRQVLLQRGAQALATESLEHRQRQWQLLVVEDKGKRVISSLFYLSPKLGNDNYNLTPMAYMRIMFFSGR